jgi:hypothetical protein
LPFALRITILLLFGTLKFLDKVTNQSHQKAPSDKRQSNLPIKKVKTSKEN